MNIQVIRWSLDLAMGVAFFLCFITGIFKLTILMRTLGLTNLVLPLAMMSNIHDVSGIALGFFVVAHLFVNRAWIIAMTKKILSGVPLSQ